MMVFKVKTATETSRHQKRLKAWPRRWISAFEGQLTSQNFSWFEWKQLKRVAAVRDLREPRVQPCHDRVNVTSDENEKKVGSISKTMSSHDPFIKNFQRPARNGRTCRRTMDAQSNGVSAAANKWFHYQGRQPFIWLVPSSPTRWGLDLRGPQKRETHTQSGAGRWATCNRRRGCSFIWQQQQQPDDDSRETVGHLQQRRLERNAEIESWRQTLLPATRENKWKFHLIQLFIVPRFHLPVRYTSESHLSPT